jgi:hypothetical protein
MNEEKFAFTTDNGSSELFLNELSRETKKSGRETPKEKSARRKEQKSLGCNTIR